MPKILENLFYGNFLDLYPDPILIVTRKNFIIKYINIESEIFFGKSKSYLLVKDLDLLFGKNSYLVSGLKKVVKEIGLFSIKDVNVKFNKQIEVICVVNDAFEENVLISIKKESKKPYQQDLDYNFKILDETFSILSHEVNNPISSIQVASQLIEKNISPDDKELITIIKNECQRISNLIKSLSMTNSKNFIISKTNQNIHEILRYALINIKMKSSGMKIIEDFDPSLPNISFDRDLIIQVFENLFLNAYESSQLNNFSYLKVTTKFIFGQTMMIPNLKKNFRQNLISIIVEDNGKGIDEKIKEKIFFPFFSTKEKGSGIGLFLVKKIINEHQGDVIVKSENNLTKFIIKLPI